MDEPQFIEKYWMTNTKIVTVTNPRTEDFVFQSVVEVGVDMATGKMRSEPRHYRVLAGETERFPGTIANLYLDQMSKMIAQDEDKFQFLIDFALKAQYYDQLIVDIEDLINDYVPRTEYLEKKEPEVKQSEEEAFPEAKPRIGRPPKIKTEV